jgi:hypothetical protein
MRTKRPAFLIITNKNVNINTLDSEIRNLLNTRVNWERHINNTVASAGAGGTRPLIVKRQLDALKGVYHKKTTLHK